jgi:hypothetical protein
MIESAGDLHVERRGEQLSLHSTPHRAPVIADAEELAEVTEAYRNQVRDVLIAHVPALMQNAWWRKWFPD